MARLAWLGATPLLVLTGCGAGDRGAEAPAYEGRLEAVYSGGDFFDSAIIDGDGNTLLCDPSISLVPELDCAFAAPAGPSADSQLRLAGLNLLVLLFLDPLVIEAPLSATNFSGTYNNGAGVSGNLLLGGSQ